MANETTGLYRVVGMNRNTDRCCVGDPVSREDAEMCVQTGNHVMGCNGMPVYYWIVTADAYKRSVGTT